MSSDGSVSSRISQFGLYRTIDARTEEFLKLSKKRQIRQGCVCAAISTALTVTVVVIVLLICEYMIVVETNIVQNRRHFKRNKTVALNDHPIADRLDRSYFGFDQDYYERMPLLVNAMQENSYADPSTEIFQTPHEKRNLPDIRHIKLTTEHYRPIRRTSPRPFLYEYKNPIPAPFSKTHSKSHASRSWVESYRNAQRLKNLNEIIRYLERTINAKFGDLRTQTQTRIAFSGLYVEPFKEEHKESDENDLLIQSSNKHELKSNHKSDPLYTFKPDHPGEINLLAEGMRFAPVPMLHFANEIIPNIPIFRPILNNKKCFGRVCNQADTSKEKLSHLGSPDTSMLNDANALKPFGVFLNLYPIQPTKSIDTYTSSAPSSTEIDKIYFTTSRPRFQFRRKSSFPVRRTSMKNKPRFSSKVKNIKTNSSRPRDVPRLHDLESTTIPKMIVHVNVFSLKKEIEKNDNHTEKLISSTQTEPSISSTSSTFRSIIDDYPILNSSHVEDYHIGSSGIIPIEERSTQPPTLPIITPIIPIYSMSDTSSEIPTTAAPEVIKFSPEDAKIPDQYLNLRKTEEKQEEVTEMINFNEPIKHKENPIERRTLITRLRNSDISSTTLDSTEDYEEVTQTYVPQINGHYRSLRVHKNLSDLLRENSEKYRRKLENSVTNIRKSTYVPYVEIHRTHDKSKQGDDTTDE